MFVLHRATTGSVSEVQAVYPWLTVPPYTPMMDSWKKHVSHFLIFFKCLSGCADVQMKLNFLFQNICNDLWSYLCVVGYDQSHREKRYRQDQLYLFTHCPMYDFMLTCKSKLREQCSLLYAGNLSHARISEFAHFSFTLSLCCKHSKTQHLYFYQYINQCYLSTWICSHTSKMLAVLPCWAALYIAVNTLGVHTDWKSCANRDTRLVWLMVLFIRDRLMNWCSFSKVQNVHHQHDVALTAD